jgi:hypothetical protein
LICASVTGGSQCFKGLTLTTTDFGSLLAIDCRFRHNLHFSDNRSLLAGMVI